MLRIPRVYINPGHSDKDPGAVGYETERRLSVAVSRYMNDYLLANYECETKVTPGSMDSLNAVCKEANEWGADLFVSNHFNAAGGDGFECYIHNWKRKDLGMLLAKQVEAIGQNLRMPDNAGEPMGVKVRPNLIVLKNTNMPAILTEGAFVDNLEDIQDWNDNFELQKLGEAYAKAAVEYLNLEEKKKNKTYYVRCTMNVGPFAEKETAENLLVALKSANADVSITEE